MEHPHAWVLRAIADGAAISDFEVYREHHTLEWENASEWFWMLSPSDWQVRRKQKTIKVNGFDVPEPVRHSLEYDTSYFSVSVSNVGFSTKFQWENDPLDKLWLSRGLIHLTEENAIAHAKAMLGIDPNT
jgi:hypothetical protein